MRSKVYVTVGCPSVRLSVPSINRSSSVRWVCCWAPRGQEISIASGGRRASWRPAATAPRHGSAAANAADCVTFTDAVGLEAKSFGLGLSLGLTLSGLGLDLGLMASGLGLIEIGLVASNIYNAHDRADLL